MKAPRLDKLSPLLIRVLKQSVAKTKKGHHRCPFFSLSAQQDWNLRLFFNIAQYRFFDHGFHSGGKITLSHVIVRFVLSR
jgi:hypothetical protein